MTTFMMKTIIHLCFTISIVAAFSTTSRSSRASWRSSLLGGGRCGNGKGANNNNNNNNIPPPPPPPLFSSSSAFDEDDNDDDNKRWENALLFFNLNQQQEESNIDDECSTQADDDNDNDSPITSSSALAKDSLRGGSSENNDLLAKGSKSTFNKTINFWSDTFHSFQNSIKSTFNRPFSSSSKNKKSKKGDNNDKKTDIDPNKIIIESVSAPQSTILPDTVVRSAAQRSGLVGSTLTTNRVQECAKSLKKWYLQRGYVLHSVTGATLHTSNQTASLSVEEPLLSDVPVEILFAKEVPVDPETGKSTTFKQYREKWERTKGLRGDHQQTWPEVRETLNMTLVETTGRTKPRVISNILGFRPGRHFQWDAPLWDNIVKSGIFSRVYRASPTRMEDGTVQLNVLASEPPPRNLEYGISKSLYTGSWEGELDFTHGNVLGGGEKLGLIVRRGARDKEPSAKLRFTDDKFGMAGGYDVELFNDYIATEHSSDDEVTTDESVSNASSGEDGENDNDIRENYDEDALLCRKGITYRLRSPIPQRLIRQSTSSASLERVSTRTGRHESVGSMSIDLGPFNADLPLGARSNIATSLTSGTRISEYEERNDDEASWCMLPYSSGSVTTRQLFPILGYSTPNNRRVNLALQHTVMSSTKHLPRHEANAAGFAAKVRGYSPSSNGPVGASLVGTTEIRVPVTVPFNKNNVVQDTSVVVFGDWMIAKRRYGENQLKKASVGLGLRKTLQGIPVKYDLSLSMAGKIGASFSLGYDWNI